MYTFGFYWKVWESAEPIAKGEDILTYLREAAEEHGLVEKIRFNTDISSARWSSVDKKWHLVTKSGAKFNCDVFAAALATTLMRTHISPSSLDRRSSQDQSSTHRSGLRSTAKQ